MFRIKLLLLSSFLFTASLWAAGTVKEDIRLGVALIERGQLDAGLKRINKNLKLDVKLSAEVLHSALEAKGLALLQKEQINLAIEALKRALKLNAGSEKSWRLLTMAYDMKGDEKALLEAFESAVKHQPNSSDLRRDYGMSLLESGDAKKAEAQLLRALKLSNRRPDIVSDAAYLKLYQKDYKAAQSLVIEALQDFPGDANLYYVLGDALMGLEQSSKAARAYQKALKDDPNYTPALFKLALIHFKSGDVASAESAFRALLKREPTHLKAKAYLGVVLAEEKKDAEAQKVLEEVLKQAPNFKDGRMALISVYERQGMVLKASRLRKQIRKDSE